MIRAFFHHGYLLKELNETNITLIQKKQNPTKVNDFRPISLYDISDKFSSNWQIGTGNFF